MNIFLHSISGVIIILVLIIVGYVLAAMGWFPGSTDKLIAKLVTQLALPCYMIATITSKFTSHELISIVPDLVFPVLSMLILMVIALLFTRILKVDPSHRGLFSSMFFNSNTVFVGLPINQALFGSKSIPFVLIYYMANTTIFWTIGTYFIQKDGSTEATFNWKITLKKVLSPPLLGFIVGVVLVLLNIKLPLFLSKDLSYLGNLTTPLSMIFIGICVYNAGLKQLTLKKDNLLILLGRFVLAPLLMTLLVAPTNFPVLMKQVFILQSAMPVMTNAPVVARLYNADADYASVMVTETTFLALLVVPILMVLTQGL